MDDYSRVYLLPHLACRCASQQRRQHELLSHPRTPPPTFSITIVRRKRQSHKLKPEKNKEKKLAYRAVKPLCLSRSCARGRLKAYGAYTARIGRGCPALAAEHHAQCREGYIPAVPQCSWPQATRPPPRNLDESRDGWQKSSPIAHQV